MSVLFLFVLMLWIWLVKELKQLHDKRFEMWFVYDRVCAEVTQCGWQVIEIHLTLTNYLRPLCLPVCGRPRRGSRHQSSRYPSARALPKVAACRLPSHAFYRPFLSTVCFGCCSLFCCCCCCCCCLFVCLLFCFCLVSPDCCYYFVCLGLFCCCSFVCLFGVFFWLLRNYREKIRNPWSVILSGWVELAN